MDVNFSKKVSASKPYHKFNLLYDGLETYYLFYKDKEIFSIISNELPKELHKKLMYGEDSITSKTFTSISIDDNGKISSDDGKYTELEVQLIKSIGELIDKPSERLMVCQELIRTLKDSVIDSVKLSEHISNSSEIIQDKLLELSAIHNDDKDNILDIEKAPMSIEEQIEARRNPVLTSAEIQTAKTIKTVMQKEGLIDYMNNVLDSIHLGDHRNILRKTLMVFSIMMGKGSFLSETVAEKEAGKSFEDDIVFSIITPPRYIFKANDMTDASLKRFGAISEYYFDRQIILFGDLGSTTAFKKLEQVFNIMRPLITEKEYVSHKADNNDSLKNIDLHLKVSSFGAVYSTIENSFTKDDEQLISRTLKSTPTPVNEKDVMKHLFYLNNPYSKQSKARAVAIDRLKDFGLYMLSLVKNDIVVINPYEEVFLNYALISNSPKRELKQQMELFSAYCILTSYECETIGQYQVASIKQLSDYMNQINLENALIPYENDFLKMLMATGNKYELSILYDINLNEKVKDIRSQEYIEDPEKEVMINKIRETMKREDVFTIIECENNAIPYIRVRSYSDDDLEQSRLTSKEHLTTQQLNELPNKLNMMYGIRGTSSIHTNNRIFFRVSDLKNIYGQRKAYKNIDNVPKLLNSLYDKGYLGKYEQKLGKENLYYLTDKCKKISSEFEPTKSFDEYWNSHKRKTGL